MGRILNLFFTLSVLSILSGCKKTDKNTTDYNQEIGAIDPASVANLDGKQLSEIYCAICHKYPAPSLLDKHTWQYGILPNMGRRLGIKTWQNPYDGFPREDVEIMKSANIYPEKPMISVKLWDRINEFYFTNSPDSLPRAVSLKTADTTLTRFKVHLISNARLGGSMVTYVGYNPFNEWIYIGDMSNNLALLDKNGKQVTAIKLPSPVVHVNFIDKNHTLVTCVGILFPDEQFKGRIYEYDNKADTLLILKDLQRPVYTEIADLDKDGKDDLIISEYGNQTGKLTWYKNQGNRKYIQHILIHEPGAERTETYDFNKDGLPDIMALLAQGNERIMIFFNQGNGEFSSVTPLRFPPVYGSLYFELVDFNRDGFRDIIYTSGDNADKSMVLKPYHGIYIYLNDGNNNFYETFFYPMNGSIKALPYDYDQDGDLDIATISFFPDFKENPVQGFLMLENISKEYTNFNVITFNDNQSGRWLVMNRADYDQDGDEDLFMGSFLFSVSPVPVGRLKGMMQSGVNVIILENLVK